jgi:acetolactate synthase regulatory subunit
MLTVSQRHDSQIAGWSASPRSATRLQIDLEKLFDLRCDAIKIHVHAFLAILQQSLEVALYSSAPVL